ncbi:hypothetical protein [Xanthomonas sp. SI]|uniref:hypothetical protein n=1 Tax=Xanthomonas sp. SI TaxID=2724123 RepID=UPI00163A7E7C|nr:hypothetical protein [Xanthomonas sp. SI]QNH11189.1 hypothetical protein HEP75_00607 [Xanthomonas sp. SI]
MASANESAAKTLASGAAINLTVLEQWRRFRNLIVEPWTLMLLVASIVLFVIGQQQLKSGVNALIQILLAVSSGVLGARVTELIAEARGQNVLTARGTVAVRGLKLMLVQTAAFERRLHKFRNHRKHIESNPDVTERNYEEAIEFCKRIQEEAASAMETWADIVPTADLSSLIGRITEAEEQRDVVRTQLESAQKELARAADDAQDAAALRERVGLLEQQEKTYEERLRSLNRRLASRTAPPSQSSRYLETALERAKEMRKKQMEKENHEAAKRAFEMAREQQRRSDEL